MASLPMGSSSHMDNPHPNMDSLNSLSLPMGSPNMAPHTAHLNLKPAPHKVPHLPHQRVGPRNGNPLLDALSGYRFPLATRNGSSHNLHILATMMAPVAYLLLALKVVTMLRPLARLLFPTATVPTTTRPSSFRMVKRRRRAMLANTPLVLLLDWLLVLVGPILHTSLVSYSL